ncbi:2-oxoglutarate dehydrogenase complex dihydrolipoyllysine-residue succinyltransferase [Desertibacillus haloalkaliphilus]|uniref:2-oxoglutarate dehydrogenase complex dihydrolipoyllysine-residue succinyltransferase n=1 Tax=Desertibacillus haloalkaliphilus TaxID=1328930 RepID=UPI001C27B11F|nr:2-oxoglutarate dehydrogenase complex dihydrolipoyllysine-residue succinyltransferase [Desertibacillus haloalkaliphilus]MBU8907603.1 2-oxoglutarate dehydrogenase complex dihydrolipoyllysine-residue succinyltransferase [Desertibacillus haloalkaliphilus]
MADIIVPELAESITEGTVAQWLKNPGDQVTKGEYIVELETDKVNVEITSDFSGVLQNVKKEAGETVTVGEVIATIEEGAEASELEQQADSEPQEKIEEAKTDSTEHEEESPQSEGKDENDPNGRPIASPAARKLARERGIDLEEVKPQDPLGRVRKHDVASHQEKPASSPTDHKPFASSQSQQQASDENNNKPVERIKMSRRRQTIANRLVDVQHQSAMLTTFNEVDMTAILNLRKRRKQAFQDEHGVKLGFMSFFTKAVVGALKKFPLLNAEIQGDEILLKHYYDIGVAVSADDGLVVPVIRDADRLDFAGIENEINDLAEKARDNKLKLNELQGGTFTITNGGVFGSLWSTPILNSPQVGILGMHKVQTRPVAIDDERMENRPMMYIALSYDHRIVDGKEAVSFLVKVKELLEDPESLLLNG